jgi:hypothetical protein
VPMELVLQLVPALRQVTAAHHLLEDGKVFVRDSSKGVFHTQSTHSYS